MSSKYCNALAAFALATAGFTMPLSSHAADLATAPIAGGWSAAPLQDENVKRAAQFALTAQEHQTRASFKLLAIKHARQQVVAGTNYSMNLMVQYAVGRLYHLGSPVDYEPTPDRTIAAMAANADQGID